MKHESLANAMKAAFYRTGAPGLFDGYDHRYGVFQVRLQYGTRQYRYKLHDGNVTVICRWEGNCRQATERYYDHPTL